LTPINTERREEVLARRHEEHKEEKTRIFSHKKAQKTQKAKKSGKSLATD